MRSRTTPESTTISTENQFELYRCATVGAFKLGSSATTWFDLLLGHVHLDSHQFVPEQRPFQQQRDLFDLVPLVGICAQAAWLTIN
jgi:hypothetical protein